MTRAQLYQRIAELPPEQRREAAALALEVYGYEPTRPRGAVRDVGARRALAGDPWKYMRDIFGYRLTEQQERALEEIEKFDRVLIPSGNNLGKTWLLAAYGTYRFDAVAALPDVEQDLDEQGARVLLPGPSRDTIFATIYAKMLAHASRAERRGHIMPGYRSEKSILWRVRPEWEVEAFAPAKSVDQNVAHTASGRHHLNQVALLEEMQGLEEFLVAAVEGMCSGQGNKMIGAFNPTESAGPAYARAQRGGWRVLHLSAFDHPNVRGRQVVVPGAVAFTVIDEKVRRQCDDRGPFPEARPDQKHREFVYAVPQLGTAEKGPREDDQLGHPDAPLRVYRPGPLFEAQVLGQWPSSSDSRLFSAARLQEAQERHRNTPEPKGKPDRVGLDAAREGGDEPCAAPAWGPTAETMLRAYVEAETEQDGAALEELRARRIRVGRIVVLPKGDGPTVAAAAVREFPYSPLLVDEGGVGTSVLDHAARVIQTEAFGISFGAAPPRPTPGEPWSENMRTAMYVRAALLSALGLVDLPDDPLLIEELLAMEVETRYRSVEISTGPGTSVKEHKPTLLLISKDELRKRLGRSPDRADAFVLSLVDPPRRKKRMVFV